MTYYEELGLKETASDNEIKQAFRKLAKENHPDKTMGDKKKEEKFKKVNTAYQTLSDPTKKKEYDATLKYSYTRNTRGSSGAESYNYDYDQKAPFGKGRYEDFFSDGVFDDIFKDIYKNAKNGAGTYSDGTKTRTSSGENVDFGITLTFLEAAYGCEKTIIIPKRLGMGDLNVNITIPPGADNNSIFVMEMNGKKLRFEVYVMDDTRYQRVGQDIYTTIKVPLMKTIVGGKVMVNHRGKDFEVTIPEGSHSGQVLRLRGMGIAKNNSVGNLMVVVNIDMPKNLTEKQKKLLNDFQKIEDKKKS